MIRDPDTAQRGFHVVTVSGPHAAYVRVESLRIVLARVIDRDAPSPLRFSVTVRDNAPTPLSVTRDVVLSVTNAPPGSGGSGGGTTGGSASGSTKKDYTLVIVGAVVAALLFLGTFAYMRHDRKRREKARIEFQAKVEKRRAARQPYAITTSRWFSNGEQPPEEPHPVDFDEPGEPVDREYLELIGGGKGRHAPAPRRESILPMVDESAFEEMVFDLNELAEVAEESLNNTLQRRRRTEPAEDRVQRETPLEEDGDEEDGEEEGEEGTPERTLERPGPGRRSMVAAMMNIGENLGAIDLVQLGEEEEEVLDLDNMDEA